MPYPDWAGDDVIVSHPGALFFITSAAPLDKLGDVYQFPVFSKDELLLIQLEVLKEVQAKVDYVEQSASGERRIKKTVPALKLGAETRPLGPDAEEGDMEFIGLQGNVEILLDKSTRVPLLISGKVKFAGRVNIKLRRVVRID